MRDEKKSREQLISELEEMRRWVEELKKKETGSLRDSLDRYSTIVNNIPSLVCRFLPDGTLTFVNEHYCRYFNQSREELEGANLFQFIPEGERERVQGHYASLTAENPIITYEHQVTAPGGAIRWQRWTDQALFNEQGDLFEYQSMGEDITESKLAEDALRDSEEKYRELVENINNVIYATDENGVLTFASPAVEPFLGYHPSEIIGRSFREFFDKADFPLIMKNFTKILSGQISSGEYRVQTKSGDKRWMHTSSRPIILDGRVAGVQGVLSDITERKKTETALRESEEKFRTLAEQTPNMIFINKGGCIVYANIRCEEVMGYTREEFYAPDFSFLDLIAPEHRDLVLSNFHRHMDNEEIEPHEYTLMTKTGGKIEVLLTTRLMNYEGESAILGTVTDITERKRAEEHLAYIATHDSLTGLPNRSLFYDRLDHAIHAARRNGYGLAVAFLDLDGFKTVNDTYGHEKGDILLKDVAMRLNSSIRESDSVARLGGDEFTFVFEKIHKPDDATTIAEKILSTLSAPFEVSGEVVYITASIGISVYPEDGDNTAELLKKADSAMYAAKDLAHNSYRLYSS